MLQKVFNRNSRRRNRMKQPKRLTRQQKECLSAHYLNADNWMLVEETDFYLKIINKHTGKVRNADKFKRTKKGTRRYARNNIDEAGN